MDQIVTTDRVSEQDVAAAPGVAATTPAIAIVEERDRLSREFRHVFDYLGIRADRMRSVTELRAALQAGPPMAVIWEVAAGLDCGEIMRAISETDRDLPVLLVAEDDGRSLALLDSLIRFWRMVGVTKLARQPELRELVEFVFQAGRRSGEFRVLSI